MYRHTKTDWDHRQTDGHEKEKKNLKNTNTVVNADAPDTECLYYSLVVKGVTLKSVNRITDIYSKWPTESSLVGQGIAIYPKGSLFKPH